MKEKTESILHKLGKFFSPIKQNATFFVFMYLLGIVCAIVTLPKRGELYDNLWLELFVDLDITCFILTLIPYKVRRWIRLLLYIIMYSVALVDVYCFVNYDSTLNPSMLMLVGETDSREAGEFLTTVFSSSVIFSNVGWVLLLILLNILVAFCPWLVKKLSKKYQSEYLFGKYKSIQFFKKFKPALGICCLLLFIIGCITSAHNKAATFKLMSGRTIGEVEHTLTEKDHAVLYVPVNRLIFSVYANSLASKQVDQLIAAAGKVKVDSCSYKSPTIVLIIGESYAKNHSQQYGYFKETTPRQVKLEKSRYLTKFDDVISCWNLTSFVFKNMLSLHVIGEKGEWCDYPLFPELFRKAGYHVSFLTNQFLPKASEEVYDFSGGFFLNNPELTKEQFDTRNKELYQYDDGLLRCYDEMVKNEEIKISDKVSLDSGKLNGTPNLVIFHLLGQHVTYRTRYPKNQTHFWASQYEEERPELSDRQRKVLSQYDNAVLYNDSIVNQIIRRFRKKDAIVVYMPDHGEECYEDDRGFICRNHSAAIDWPLAHYEFEVPFWIYCSPKYKKRHPEIYKQVREASHRRFMTDAMPHLLLYLAGIHAKDYKEEYNLLSPKYNEKRPRILKNTTDYDKLRDKELKKKQKNNKKK